MHVAKPPFSDLGFENGPNRLYLVSIWLYTSFFVCTSLKPAIHLSSNWWEREKVLTKREMYRAFCKPFHLSFFSSGVSPFSSGDQYFYEMSKRMIWQVYRQVSRRIKDEQNWRYCEKCIVIGSQSQKIVHKIMHEHVETWETIYV